MHTLLLITSEELNYSDEQDIKTSDSKVMFWRPRYAEKLLQALVKCSYPPTLQPIPPGCNFQETERFNAALVEITPWILAAETVMTACSSGLLY